MSVFSICVFLWLADIADKASKILNLSIVLFYAFWIIGLIVWVSLALEEKSDGKNALILYIKKTKGLLISAFCLMIFVSFMPTKQGVYMIGGTIAGSVVYDKVSNTKEYEKLMELFNLALDKQIRNLRSQNETLQP